MPSATNANIHVVGYKRNHLGGGGTFEIPAQHRKQSEDLADRIRPSPPWICPRLFSRPFDYHNSMILSLGGVSFVLHISFGGSARLRSSGFAATDRGQATGYGWMTKRTTNKPQDTRNDRRRVASLIGRLFCLLGIHDFKITDATVGFGSAGGTVKVQCKRCGRVDTRSN